MSIAVTGSTGQLGRLAIEQLKERLPSNEIVALARDTERASDLGVEARRADYEEPASLLAALEGVSTLLLISASDFGKRAAQHKNVITAAKQAGVKRVVYTSLLRADTSALSLAAEHVITEAELRDSGLEWTILRNGWYSENYSDSILAAAQAGALIGSARDGKISGATRADLAEAAAVVVTSDGHAGKTYELVGDEAWTLTDLAAEISRQTGKEIPYRDLPAEEYAKILVQNGLPEGMAQFIAQSDVDASNGELYAESRELSGLLGRPTTPLSAAVEEALASAAAEPVAATA